MSTLTIKCPSCQKAIEYSDKYPHRPFCSERCKLIDLGEWASESHKIPGSSIYDDILSKNLEDDEGY